MLAKEIPQSQWILQREGCKPSNGMFPSTQNLLLKLCKKFKGIDYYRALWLQNNKDMVWDAACEKRV